MEVSENHKRNYKLSVFGIEGFVNYACQSLEYLNEGTIRCPCLVCDCGKRLKPGNVKYHLYANGFKDGYWGWINPGEIELNLTTGDRNDSETIDRPLFRGEKVVDNQNRVSESNSQETAEESPHARSKRAKRNHASNTDGCNSVGTHAQNLDEVLGGEPNVDEGFHHVHLKKDDCDLVATKATETHENFESKEREQSCQCSNELEPSTTQKSIPEPGIEITSGMKKGHSHGLGAEASSYECGEFSRISKHEAYQIPKFNVDGIIQEMKMEMMQQFQLEMIQDMNEAITEAVKKEKRRMKRRQEKYLHKMAKKYFLVDENVPLPKLDDSSQENDGDDMG